MVLIDTSVWISLYRQRSRDLGQRVWHLAARNEAGICGQVWVEFLGGFRQTGRREEYRELLGAYGWLETTRQAYDVAAQWCAGHPGLTAGDTIIAATAWVHGASLLTLDRDFERLAGEGLRIVPI